MTCMTRTSSPAPMAALFGALALVGLGACGADAPASSGEPTDAAAVLRARAEGRFVSVDFLKPRSEDPEAGLDPYLAPIVYREVPSAGGSAQDPTEFGAVELRGGELFVDGAQPTIYYWKDEAELGAARFEQLAFLWFRGAGEGCAAQGVRVTFDQDGLPAILEPLADTSGLTPLFVTEHVEGAAGERFGPPLAGRAYSAEPDLATRPDVVVVRTLSRGPEPLGPMVYDPADGADVVNLHCRCNPSHIDGIRVTVEYALRPFAGLPSDVRARVRAQVGGSEGEVPAFPAPDWPLVSLRVPELF